MPIPNSFTWSLTTAGDSGAFNTPANWVNINNGGANAPSFTDGTDSYEIFTSGSVSLTVTGLSNVNIGSLTIDDLGVNVVAGNAQATINDGLTIENGLITASSDSGAIIVGNPTTPGSIVIGSGGTLDAGSATFTNLYELGGGGPSAADLSGSGTVIANGWLQITSNVTVGSTTSLNFEIANNGGALNGSDNVSYLDFEGSVKSGSVDFLGNSGYLLLGAAQVGTGTTLTNGGTFGATVTGLAVSSNTTLLNGIEVSTNGYTGPTSLTAALSGPDNDTLTLTDGSSNHFVIDLSGDYSGDTALTQTDSINGGFDVFLSSVCYGAGTAVMTDRGVAAIETIQIGDSVMTLVDGALVPQTVKWVGHRDLTLRLHPNPDTIAPVRIMPGALGDNLPRRELTLSPDHCLFIDGGLIPARLLVNDMNIVRDLTAKNVSYYHIELERHSVMFAEGVAAESYLDTGNRAFFSNAGLATILHPELTINENLRCWETDACAPLTVRPEAVKPVWQRFADRAVALGHTPPVHETTRDAGIHLTVDGKVVRPLVTQGKTVSFTVPANSRSVRLVSRATRPSTLTPWLDDPRNLGIAVRSVTLRDQTGESVISADHPGLRDGWHAAEFSTDGALWRWTAGDAVLPIQTAGPCTVEIALGETATYIENADRLAA